ncbi:hypothetical protein SH601_04590 [Gracilibacillus sp. S3-1-1]|uniref:Uncharacterized protein n=1 Tax=Gracilibacillus pellucidus TaxID=3095368 RepID=A0ACC6M2V9_9BACI|nr:hypothetical protein [Gracilibacillus sp. S3-1-1]MDX8045259.1 hypothetical protein [Gracilibacillus sp. S3-1-1]
MFNPSTEIAAFLIHWSPNNSEAAQLGLAVVDKAIAHLMESDKMDSHECKNFQQLLKVLEKHDDDRLFNDIKGKKYTTRLDTTHSR